MAARASASVAADRLGAILSLDRDQRAAMAPLPSVQASEPTEVQGTA